MNQSHKSTVTPIHAPLHQALSRASVTAELSNESWQLDHQVSVKRAFSCIVKPQVGDEVLYCDGWILAILNRNTPSADCEHEDHYGQVSLPSQAKIQIKANAIDVLARQKMHLACAKDVEITSLTGSVSMTAKNLMQTVQQSLIQLSKCWLNRSENAEMKVSKLLKTQARHQVITADKEMKMDAERINMG